MPRRRRGRGECLKQWAHVVATESRRCRCFSYSRCNSERAFFPDCVAPCRGTATLQSALSLTTPPCPSAAERSRRRRSPHLRSRQRDGAGAISRYARRAHQIGHSLDVLRQPWVQLIQRCYEPLHLLKVRPLPIDLTARRADPEFLEIELRQWLEFDRGYLPYGRAPANDCIVCIAGKA